MLAAAKPLPAELASALLSGWSKDHSGDRDPELIYGKLGADSRARLDRVVGLGLLGDGGLCADVSAVLCCVCGFRRVPACCYSYRLCFDRVVDLRVHAWSTTNLFWLMCCLLTCVLILSSFDQIWTCYVQKSGEGLSLVFLAIWLAGDLTNLLGSFWQQLLPTGRRHTNTIIRSDQKADPLSLSQLSFWLSTSVDRFRHRSAGPD